MLCFMMPENVSCKKIVHRMSSWTRIIEDIHSESSVFMMPVSQSSCDDPLSLFYHAGISTWMTSCGSCKMMRLQRP
jgi:hypothetical protein